MLTTLTSHQGWYKECVQMWPSNGLISGPLIFLKIVEDTQRAFVYMGYYLLEFIQLENKMEKKI